MKKTKKLLACLIAAATMFTMGSTAFAAETAEAETKTPVDSVTLTKSYKLEVADMKSPAETFNYTVTELMLQMQPAILQKIICRCLKLLPIRQNIRRVKQQ